MNHDQPTRGSRETTGVRGRCPLDVDPIAATQAGEEAGEGEWLRLAEGCRQRDQAAFARVVALVDLRLRRLIYKLAGPAADGDGLLQETYLRAWQGIDRFRGESHPRTWLTRIAINVVLNSRRDQRRETTVSDDAGPTAISQALAGVMLNEAAMLRAYEVALARLTDDQRTAYALHETENLSYRDIAAVLNCPLGTVMSRLHRAREQLMHDLRELLEEFTP